MCRTEARCASCARISAMSFAMAQTDGSALLHERRHDALRRTKRRKGDCSAAEFGGRQDTSTVGVAA
jgi:hypothetical protein